MSKLPEWPTKPEPLGLELWDYAEKRVAYWESRCRLAVAWMQRVHPNDAANVLQAIGPLPPEGKP